jgi:hypothetical protein
MTTGEQSDSEAASAIPSTSNSINFAELVCYSKHSSKNCHCEWTVFVIY